VVTLPLPLLGLGDTQSGRQSGATFAQVLGLVLSQRLDRWTRVTVEPDSACRIADVAGRPIELAWITAIDSELDRLLTRPSQWAVRESWWWTCEWVDTDRYAGVARWPEGPDDDT
jgi:hypothetical protein